MLFKDTHLDLPEADIRYTPNFIDSDEATHLFQLFKNQIPWQQDNIRVYGKTYAQPRLTALFGNNGKPYSYSNITMVPHPFTPELKILKERIDQYTKKTFTTCLMNLYRDGKDSNGWHADDEKELGSNPVIASLTLGQERYFHLRHKNDKFLKKKLLLGHGSLLLMQGQTQHYWQHQIPKTTKNIGERINLTFRIIP
ncbi:MAG: alpha-ketoglutarate-dependent dioxygenase AlkB [Croceitalea sp.]|nr:alpha-ketoglutarate-dependent dioxygenase AlkB [Croceitalea sp.]MBT8237267.1 alpha-ketoglutarate-dependent dioxygenase AlkB [Croceitalea sp.]NNL08262.1 alpha-ketoglutarate-dependent dioxygenase AlkB [Croceitalea sp.]NNM19274.1 alpha-ketoglutarate-dependent dioxygenase AlkB [Croceitalea sp.]